MIYGNLEEYNIAFDRVCCQQDPCESLLVPSSRCRILPLGSPSAWCLPQVQDHDRSARTSVKGDLSDA